MEKKGQITIFIVVGILILAVVGILFSLKASTEKKQLEQPLYLDTQSIELYVQQCQEKAVKDAILDTGKSGGYAILPELSTTNLQENVPYYQAGEQNTFPIDELLAREIARYVDLALPLCLHQFRSFEREGYSITTGTPTSTARLSQKKLTLITMLPLTVSQGIQMRDLSIFTADVPAEQFYQNLQLARAVINSLPGEGICLTCFAALAEEQNTFVGVVPLGKKSYLFELQDQDYSINSEQYIFRFAVRLEHE
jgi:hypothetical protein